MGEMMDIDRREIKPGIEPAAESLTALIKLAAAVTVNNVVNTKSHIEAASRLGATANEIQLAIKLAKVIRNRAGEFVDEAIDEAMPNYDAKN